MKTCNRCNQIPSNYNYTFCPSCGQQLTIAEDIDNKIDNLESQYDILMTLLEDDNDSYKQEELSAELNSIALAITKLQE